MGSILACFQKTFIFPIDFNDFINLRCQLGTILGSSCTLWGYFGVLWFHFELTLAQVGQSWRQVRPKLAQLGPKFGPSGAKKWKC